MKNLHVSLNVKPVIKMAALLLVLILSLGLEAVLASDCKTYNVLQACSVLKREHIHFDIYNINGSPACVFHVGDQLWFYDGQVGSNMLGFLPSQPCTSEYTITGDGSLPVNSCLIEALISYRKHTNYKNNAIVFLNHHAMNVYSNSSVEFLKTVEEYPAVAIYGSSVASERMAGVGSDCRGFNL